MSEEFQLEQYLTKGVEKIVKGAIKATFQNPKQSLFFAQYALASKEAAKLRKTSEEKGDWFYFTRRWRANDQTGCY